MNSYPTLLKRFVLATGISLGSIGGSGALAPANALTFDFAAVSTFTAANADYQNVLTGFQQAGALWAPLFNDNVTVKIAIDYKSLGAGTLGEASTQETFVSYQNFYNALSADSKTTADTSAVNSLTNGANFNRLINYTSNNPNGAGSTTAYPDTDNQVALTTANARALGINVNPTTDAIISFNSDSAWDFKGGTFDFVGVAAHEIGHALGFVSSVDNLDRSGGTANANAPEFTVTSLDLFRYSAASKAQNAIDFTVGKADKYFSIDKGNTAIAAFATGSVNGDGWMAGHWQDNASLGIMDPTTSPDELLQISQNDVLAFDAIGWDRSTVPLSARKKVPEPASYVGTLVFMAVGVRMLIKHKRNLAKSIELASSPAD